ncbi:MAG: DUF4234 domain-containing protein [Nitrososphaerota archaeon]|nr:DUF4234 domain-containing protein [Nitrososphaerota archaeon]
MQQYSGNVTNSTMSVDTGKTQFSQSLAMRRDSDRIMSVGWVFLPFIGIILGVVGIVVSFTSPLAGVGLTIGLSFLDLVLVVVFWYFLISRRNNHFKRDKLERESLIEYLKQAGAASGRSNDIATELATMNAVNAEATTEEETKSAALWIVLTIVTFGIAGLYVLYFLTRDPYKHDSKQQSFMQQTQSALAKLGKPIVNPSWKALPSRSFILYLILDIVTLGLFGFYWYYVLIKDFNDHFKAQWQLEDSIMSIM